MDFRLTPPSLVGARKSLGKDAVAGIALAAVAVPGSMATAQLLGLDPTTGLIGFAVAALVFTVVGAHKTLNVGPDLSITPMLAVAAASSTVAGGVDPTRVVMVSVLAGLLLVLVWVVKGGWITQFLSRPVTLGLLAGIGVSVFIQQLPTALGLEQEGESTLEHVGSLMGQLDRVSWPSIGVAAVVIVVTLVGSVVGPRFPGTLAGLGLATWAGSLMDVDTLPNVSSGIPSPTWPPLDWALAWDVLPTALVIVVLIVMQTGAVEADTEQGHRTLDRDLGAIGISSALAGMLGAFAVNASPPRTKLVMDAGAKTQVAGLVAGALLLIAALAGGGFLSLLPEPALAAVLLIIAASLIRVGEFRRILAYSRIEAAVAVGTLALVLSFGIVEGVTIAALVTLMDRTRREARPPTYKKGLMPTTNHWVPVDAGVETAQVPGVLVWSVEASIWYADASFVVDRLHGELDAAPGDPYSAVVLDAGAVSDVDFTGVTAFSMLIDDLSSRNVPLYVARPTLPVRRALERAGLTGRVGLHPTVADAVEKAVSDAGLEDELRAARAKKGDIRALHAEGLEPDDLLGPEQLPDSDDDPELPPFDTDNV